MLRSAPQAYATHTCAIDDHVSHPVTNDFSYPTGCQLRFQFAQRGDRPGVELFWYDGGMKPRLPEEVERHDVEMELEGILFVGTEGAIMAGFHGQQPRLYKQGKVEPLDTSDDQATPSSGGSQRARGWMEAVLEGGESSGSFLNAAAITDTVNLGTVALRAGRRVLFDSQQTKITNVESANRYLRRDYRPGWEL